MNQSVDNAIGGYEDCHLVNQPSLQDAFEQVCDVFRNIQFVTGSDPKKYPVYAAATEGLRLAEPHCKPREPYVKSGIGQSSIRKYGETP